MIAHNNFDVNYTIYVVLIPVERKVVVIQTNPFAFISIPHIAQWLHHTTYSLVMCHTTHNLMTSHTTVNSVTNSYYIKLRGVPTTHTWW